MWFKGAQTLDPADSFICRRESTVHLQQERPGLRLCACRSSSSIWQQLAAQGAHQRQQWLRIFGICRREGLRRW